MTWYPIEIRSELFNVNINNIFFCNSFIRNVIWGWSLWNEFPPFKSVWAGVSWFLKFGVYRRKADLLLNPIYESYFISVRKSTNFLVVVNAGRPKQRLISLWSSLEGMSRKQWTILLSHLPIDLRIQMTFDSQPFTLLL